MISKYFSKWWKQISKFCLCLSQNLYSKNHSFPYWKHEKVDIQCLHPVSCILYPVSCILYPVSCILYLVFFIFYPVSCILYPVLIVLYSLSCIPILYPVSCILYPVSFILYQCPLFCTCIMCYVIQYPKSSIHLYPVSFILYSVSCIIYLVFCLADPNFLNSSSGFGLPAFV